MKKRVLSVGIALLVVAMLAGCSGGGKKTETTTTTAAKTTKTKTTTQATTKAGPKEYTFKNISFTADSKYPVEQNEKDDTVVFLKGKAFTLITATDYSGEPSDTMLFASHAGALASFNTQGNQMSETTVAGLPAKITTANVYLNGTWGVLAVTSFQYKTNTYTFTYIDLTQQSKTGYPEAYMKIVESVTLK